MTGPQPLNEHFSTSVSEYSTAEVPREQRVAPQPTQHNPYDAPISTSDPRYKIYFHLKNLFPEKTVRRVMNKYPTEMDPNKITAAVLQVQSKTSIVC